MPRQNPVQAEPIVRAKTVDAYSRWAPIYDLVFDLPFHLGRSAAARAANDAAGPNSEMLVVGVGTGMELGLLAKSLRVTGIDLSAPVLKVARERVARLGLRQVKALQLMDATALEFPPGSFDVALAPYVMSVVPDPRGVDLFATLLRYRRSLRIVAVALRKPKGRNPPSRTFRARRHATKVLRLTCREKISRLSGSPSGFPLRRTPRSL